MITRRALPFTSCRLRTAITALLLVALPMLASAAGNPSTPAEQYHQLLNQYRTAQTNFFKADRAAKTVAERRRISTTNPTREYARRFLALAQKYPGDTVAFDALAWVVSTARLAGRRGGPEAGKALSILEARYLLQSDKLGPVCQSLVDSPLQQRTWFLLQVIAKNPHHDVQGLARYALAQIVKEQNPTWAERLLGEVEAKFADVKRGSGTLGEAAQSELPELHALDVGKPAPEIQGQDVDGKEFKLSDYRGKVVMLDFWGDW